MLINIKPDTTLPQLTEEQKSLKQILLLNLENQSLMMLLTSKTNSSHISQSTKFSYALYDCRLEPLEIVISLTEDVLIDSIMILNLEHHSSFFRDFEVCINIINFHRCGR